MKKIFLTTLAMGLTLFGALAQQQNSSQNKVINDQGKTKSIAFKAGAQPSKSEAKSVLSKQLNLAENCSFKLVKTETDAIGMIHDKYQMTYKNIPVEYSHYIVHSRNSQISSLNGENYEIGYVNIVPSWTKEFALDAAKQKVGASNYLSGVSESDHAMGYTGPNTELVIFPTIPHINKVVRLAYKMDIYAADPLYRATVYVDAQTGEVFFENNKIHHTNIGANGTSHYDGNVNFTADNTGTNYRLRQTSSGNGVETYNLNNGTSYASAVDFTNATTTFTNTKGVQAHYAAEQTHACFLQKHNRNSFNNAGAAIKSYVSYSTNYVNAFWNGSVMTYGDGNGTTYGPLITLDIVGHEIAHGVTEYSANLVYQKESGALNESFSDIFGEQVEAFGKGTNNWLMGSEIFLTGSGSIRSMSNPKQYSDPDCYGGTYWTNPNCTPSSANDYCGVHSNSGVQNKWFYLLVAGGSGTNDLSNAYTVVGIGMDKAAAIAYRNLTVYLTSNSTFADARTGAIQSSIDLYGAGSPEEIATTNAWHAVGVGLAYGGITPPPPPLVCVGGNLNFILKLDNYPTETSWKIFDSLNVQVAQGSGYTTAGATTTQNINLTPGTFTFTIYDTYGDGICCSFGTGFYHLISGGDTIKSGGAFTSSESKIFCITGTAIIDTLAPTDPTNLVASNTTGSSTSLSWTASTDNVGVSSYSIFQGATQVGTSTTTNFVVSGLNLNSNYTFSVQANDAAGNISGLSNTVSITTLGDNIAPSTPTNLIASGTTTTATNLSWTASTDNVGVTLYTIYQGTTSIGTSTTTSFAVTGLTPSTAYTFSVKSQDAAGNISGSSNIISVTTLSNSTATVLHQGFFETGWDGWADGGADCSRYTGTRSAQGTYSIIIQDNSGVPSAMTSPALNLVGYNNVKVEFSFYAASMETGEDFWLQYVNGTTATTLATWVRGTNFNNSTFYTASVIVPSSAVSFINGGKFRFRCDASDNSDQIYIDKVIITGYVGAVPAINNLVDLGNPSSDIEAEITDITEELIVYPNPATETISISGISNAENFQIFDLSGKLISKGNISSPQINIQQLSIGTYILKVNTNNKSHYKRFVKH